MEDCTEEFQFDMEKKGVELMLYNRVDRGTGVYADREKLKRVVINIIQNAEKYMDKDNGKIGIIIEEDEDKVIVKIQDNGRGIPKDAQPFIFDRFYRADPSRNSSTGGSGLGLAIAKRIIEDHGGSIWAESQEGEGTCISFTLMKKN
jgi:signal transduction histidine kinase